jgi:hypothetical protein
MALGSAGSAFGQATRTWVSGVGDDVNPCSRTAPCKTFAGAISKTAVSGVISVLDPGGFGAVTITKSITIETDGAVAGILASGVDGIIVNDAGSATPNTAQVILRGLSIEGVGTGKTGVQFNAGKALFIEDCAINNFTENGVAFLPAGAATLSMKNTVVRNSKGSGFGGILIKPVLPGGSAVVSLFRVRSEGNGFGVRVEGGSKVSARECIAADNLNNGFLIFASTGAAELNLESCTASGNGLSLGASLAGILSLGPSAVVRISNTTVTDNPNGLLTSSGGVIQSFQNNMIAGNGADGFVSSTLPLH